MSIDTTGTRTDGAAASKPRVGTRAEEKRAYERNKLHKRLLRLTGQAIADFGMLGGRATRVMVCL